MKSIENLLFFLPVPSLSVDGSCTDPALYPREEEEEDVAEAELCGREA